jgi:hypothetical protein
MSTAISIDLSGLNIPKIEIEPFLFFRTDYQTRHYMTYSAIIEKTQQGSSLLKQLTEDPRVSTLRDKQISRGNGTQLFDVQTLAMWFLWYANERGIEAAQIALDSFLDSGTIAVVSALWVVGILVEAPVILRDGYTIVPASQMIDSRDKEYFLQNPIGHVAIGPPLPQCAIIKSWEIQKVPSDDRRLVARGDKEFSRITQRLHDIALLLNTITGVFCLPYYSTSYAHPSTPFGPFSGSGGGAPQYDVIVRGSAKLRNDCEATIDALLMRYEQLSEIQKARIGRILHRLAQAKGRAQIEDKILDLGIVLEMLLLDDNRNADQLSLSFRLRGSWLIGSSPEDRLAKFRQFRDIYIYRSQVAHTGMLCGGDWEKIKEVEQSFPVYQSLAEDVCKTLILRDKLDWSRLVLGAY